MVNTGGRLLAGHDHVDVIAAAQAVVGDRRQGSGIRGQTRTTSAFLLTWSMKLVLVAEAVVVLPPHVA
jgi:hypothetical protein